MSLDRKEMSDLAGREFILNNVTVDEQIGFISDQIKDPFDSGNSNNFKRLKLMVKDREVLDQYCLELFDEIADVYPKLTFDISEMDSHLDQLFMTVYKFFIKNIDKVMFIFLREYLSSVKNQKNCTSEYLANKISNYPKEQYGKKEYYVLITKLNNIIKDIRGEDLTLSEFLYYLHRSESKPLYITSIERYISDGLIVDNGVVKNMFDQLLDSEAYGGIYCKLQKHITDILITPYLENNNLIELRSPVIETEEDDLEDDEEDDDTDE